MRHGGKHTAALAAAALLLVPELAYAADIGSLMDAASEGPGAFLSYLLVEPLCSLMTDVVSPILETMMDWGLDWMEIPYVNNVIVWLQALAVLAVAIVRIGIGIKTGILKDGGEREFGMGEYLFKSLWAVVVVAVMPTLCRLVILLGSKMYDYVIILTGSTSSAMRWFDVSTLDPVALSSTGLTAVWILLLSLALMILAAACGYQFIRRQFEMLTVSIIAPVVSVYAATEDNSYQVLDLLKNLFGLVCLQWLQYLLTMVAIGFAQQWVSAKSAAAASASAAFEVFVPGAGEVKVFFAAVAAFMAALTIPRLVDRYTYSSGGSHAGGLAMSNIVSRFRPLRAAGTIIRTVRR